MAVPLAVERTVPWCVFRLVVVELTRVRQTIAKTHDGISPLRIRLGEGMNLNADETCPGVLALPPCGLRVTVTTLGLSGSKRLM